MKIIRIIKTKKAQFIEFALLMIVLGVSVPAGMSYLYIEGGIDTRASFYQNGINALNDIEGASLFYDKLLNFALEDAKNSQIINHPVCIREINQTQFETDFRQSIENYISTFDNYNGIKLPKLESVEGIDPLSFNTQIGKDGFIQININPNEKIINKNRGIEYQKPIADTLILKQSSNMKSAEGGIGTKTLHEVPFINNLNSPFQQTNFKLRIEGLFRSEFTGSETYIEVRDKDNNVIFDKGQRDTENTINLWIPNDPEEYIQKIFIINPPKDSDISDISVRLISEGDISTATTPNPLGMDCVFVVPETT